MNASRTVDQIQSELDKEHKLMEVHKTNGNYADAQVCRLKIEQLQKDHEARSLYQINIRHKHEQNELTQSNNQEFASFNAFWNKREAQILAQQEKMEAEMIARHKAEQSETKKELDIQHSPKVKESSQLLNLRKMEEYMVKQKNFGEAHKVQQQIFELQKNEKGAWMEKRDQKIQTALATLRGKQNTELTNLKKRYKTLLDECRTDRKIQDQRLLLKHNNCLKDQKSQQQKENLNLKGRFRSRGGKDSPMRTRTSFNS